MSTDGMRLSLTAGLRKPDIGSMILSGKYRVENRSQDSDENDRAESPLSYG